MKYARHSLTSLALASALAICGASAYADDIELDASAVVADTTTDGSGGKVLYDATTVLTEGESTAGYQLPAGNYLILVTSQGAGGGVKLSWSSSGCSSADETKYFNSLCILPKGGGVLKVSNPSTEWRGDETVRIQLKRVGSTVTGLVNGFVIVNETQSITEGDSRKFTLSKGSYYLSAKSQLSGVKVVWKDLACPSYSESKNYMGTCTVPDAGGTLIISNPSAEWKGDEQTAIILKKASGTVAAGTVVVNETQTIAEGSTRTFTFAPGSYKAVVSGVLNGINVGWSKTACANSVNAMGGTYPCALPNGGTLTLKNPDAPWWFGDETITVKVTKTK